jgi:DNA-binding transcriptional LysR family regulator
VFRSDDNGTVQGLVGAGMASALVPRLATDPTDERVVLVEMDEHVPARQIALAWHRDRALSPAARAFIEATSALCAGLQEHAGPEPATR